MNLPGMRRFWMRSEWLGFCGSIVACLVAPVSGGAAEPLRAGAARVEITERQQGPVNDPLFAKALVLKKGTETLVLVTLDVVAIGEIGHIGNAFLPNVRRRLGEEFGIAASNVVISASHCHGRPRGDTEDLTVRVVREAWQQLTPVRVAVGVGHEDRISENRRIRLKDGSEVDMRRAYAMPRDEDVAAVGPIDPQIGLLRLDRENGTPLAVVYHFACHPIMNPPSKGNSADFPGYASRVIEDALGGGVVAMFVQGCAGDINPVRYKEVNRPPDAEPLGTMLGARVLGALRTMESQADAPLRVRHTVMAVPLAEDYHRRIAVAEAEQKRVLDGLEPTNIRFRSFLPLWLGQKISPEFPSHHAQAYLHDRSLGRDPVVRADADNQASVDAYLRNLDRLDVLTRLAVNLALLKKHRAEAQAGGRATIEAEMVAIRVGDFRLLTFPGELTVGIGLELKKRAPEPFTFVSGYCNGYLYYLPTESQRNNSGFAQEDCDSIVAPEWRQRFETTALGLIDGL